MIRRSTDFDVTDSGNGKSIVDQKWQDFALQDQLVDQEHQLGRNSVAFKDLLKTNPQKYVVLEIPAEIYSFLCSHSCVMRLDRQSPEYALRIKQHGGMDTIELNVQVKFVYSFCIMHCALRITYIGKRGLILQTASHEASLVK
ncbi:hypothetical protein PoB_000687500 [Plakobranchus ocellatus]|uniref:Uncharacterized protein n=1 Tax=Plakobranchus ocellatus TaxID=259542 RepID=A0AAV3YCB4_9GAST|nr:hypothetical protein PoB_000687500 [Plakobranchus ocellatus]